MVWQNSTTLGVLVVLVTLASKCLSLPEIDCKGVNIKLAEDHMMEVKECVKEAGAEEMAKIDPLKMTCFGKCVMTKKGVIDDKGLPHKENIMKMIKDTLPAVVHDDLIHRMENCLNEDTTQLIDPADETCESYMPLMMCIHLAFLEVCAA